MRRPAKGSGSGGGSGGGDDEEEAAAARGAWSSYVDALAPYVIALVVTPLYDSRGAPQSLLELHDRLAEVGITPAFLNKHVYLSKANLEAGRWWTLLLHQFAHSDMTHLVNNLFTILLFGRPVHSRLGTEAVYTLLLGGSALCGYSHILGKREEKHVLAGVQSLLPRNPFGGQASRAGRWYDSTVDRFAGWLSTRIAQRVSIPAIGASGGACCLMGACVVINAEELVGVSKDLLRLYRARGQAGGSHEREVVLRRSVVRLVFIGANLFSLGSCFAQELQQALGRPKPGDMVNHRSHVDGFMIGGVVYLAWRYGPRAWARVKSLGGWGNGGAEESIWP